MSVPSAVDGVPSYGPLLPRLARLVLRVFFRRIEVVGAAAVPATGPLIYVANHNNGLVDPALVVGFLPRRPRFLAKSTLWRNPVLRPFLAAGRVVPVFREQDAGVDRSRNRQSISESREVVAQGGAIALFPEGRSHSDPALSPLKTGAARIALEAATAGVPVAIVPVGLLFDDKEQFRSRALVQVGSAIVVEPGPAGPEPAAVRTLTARIAEALAELAPGYADWDEARRIELAAEIVARTAGGAPRPLPLQTAVALRRALLDGARRARREDPGRLARLTGALDRYRDLLDLLSLRDHQVASRYSLDAVGGFVAGSLVLLLLELPVSLVGALLNWLPYRACGLVAASVARHREEPASYKMFGGLVLFPLWWGGWSVAAGARWGFFAALGVALLLPACGLLALRSRDRLRILLAEGRAWLRLVSDRRVAELRRERRVVRDEIEALARQLAEGSPPRTAMAEPG